jgi:hypothetical protein
VRSLLPLSTMILVLAIWDLREFADIKVLIAL